MNRFSSEGTYCGNLFLNRFFPFDAALGKVLFLHGFPSNGGKNVDIAEFLALNGFECHLLHYEGLGFSNGNFGFLKSIDSVFDYLNRSEVHFDVVVGHSFGGCIAYLLSNYFNNLCLLAPFITVPSTDEGLKSLSEYLMTEDTSGCLEHYSRKQLAEEIAELGSRLDKRRKQKPLSASSIVVHAKSDDVIPIAESRALAAREPHSQLLEVDSDHSLTSTRPQIYHQILGFCRG